MPLPPPVPRLPVATFHARRELVAAKMRAMAPGAVLVIHAAPVHARNHDVDHPYRQDSDLYWMTGFEEPESVLVLRAEPAPGEPAFTLFVRPRDAEKETWNGRRSGVEGAKNQFGAEVAHPIDALDAELPKLLGGTKTLFYRLGGSSPEFDARIAKTLAGLRAKARLLPGAPARIEDPAQVLHELRLIKQPEELETMRRAIELTRRGHLAAMQAGRAGEHEYKVQAELEREFRAGGGRGWGYPSIVAAGANGTVLHYIENEGRIARKDLLLVDAGAEVDFYTADVTRTFPASGRFSPLQRSAYELVLSAADQAIAQSKPGATLDQLHMLCVRVLTQGMIDLGLLKGDLELLIKDNHYRRYYMHRTSHWLGLDVHDCGSYKAPDGSARPLEPGMLFTIEPGLYIPIDDENAPEELRGLAIRIEDDLLVTGEGVEMLTGAIPRTIEEVEAACLR
jgi:Xaa-Pro aminopeptidase